MLSFNKMMFNQVVQLFQNTRAYIEGKPYDFEHSTLDVSQY